MYNTYRGHRFYRDCLLGYDPRLLLIILGKPLLVCIAVNFDLSLLLEPLDPGLEGNPKETGTIGLDFA